MGYDIYGKWHRVDGAVLETEELCDFGKVSELFGAMGLDRCPEIPRFPQAADTLDVRKSGLRSGQMRLTDFEAYDFEAAAWQT